ncbi:MAG: hypothetical protein E4G90_03570 [Gemmatimonadales bacterium]|nr:MAG: hypothetical protein E4G90_03570 [Gemmatimonadales bacterium]
MQSRRSFFGLLTGLAALGLPLPAWAHTKAPPEFPQPNFYTPTLSTDFLELPQSILIYQWDQPMVLRGVEHQVRRIKIVVPGKMAVHGHRPGAVMFNLPEHYSTAILVPRGRLIICPAFTLTDDGYVDGEDPIEKPRPPAGPDELTGRLADVIDAVAVSGFDDIPGPIKISHPMWITLHQPGESVRHMLHANPYPLGVDDMLLMLPAGRSDTRIFREPPSPHDNGEDGPWRANPGLWQPPSV